MLNKLLAFLFLATASSFALQAEETQTEKSEELLLVCEENKPEQADSISESDNAVACEQPSKDENESQLLACKDC